MNSALLDRINENDALTQIAASGGLIAAQQFEALVGGTQSTARRAYHSLVAAGMAYLMRFGRHHFILLSKRTSLALGAEHPTPPQPKAVRSMTCQLAIARVEYLLKTGRLTRKTSDLSSRKHRGSQTLGRIRHAVELQQEALGRKAKLLVKQFQQTQAQATREKLIRLKRLLRDPQDCVNSAAAVLKYRRGLYVIDPTQPALQFVFVDRATPATTYSALVSMLTTLGGATQLPIVLDVACGSERARSRVGMHLGQGELRLKLNVLNLEYDRYMSARVDLPELVDPLSISQMLSEDGNA